MKNILILLFISSILMAQAKYKPVKIWESDTTLSVCESVQFYEPDNSIFISCINGQPTEKNGKGFIAKLSIKGEIINQKWAEGLNAPKGMGIFSGKLFVTDIDRLVIIEIKNPSNIKFIKIDGAQFLNDIAIDKNGRVFISDYATSIIHKYENSKIENWLTEKDVATPNGLLIDGDDLFIGNSGSKTIKKVNLNSKENSVFRNTETGIDGIKLTDNNEFIISDWSGKTYIIDNQNKYFELLNTTDQNINSADFEYIPGKQLLFIPEFFANKVTAYKLQMVKKDKCCDATLELR